MMNFKNIKYGVLKNRNIIDLIESHGEFKKITLIYKYLDIYGKIYFKITLI